MKKVINYISKLFLIFLLAVPLIAFAQDNSSQTKAQKKAEKAKEKKLSEERKADLKGKQFHYKIQDKATRKRMKKNRRKVDHNYAGEKPPGFFKRLFGKKQPPQ